MLKSFESLRCNMGIKVHFSFSHLGSFPENLGSVSDEQEERFHQGIKIMEERYQGRWDVNTMADYCWNLKRSQKIHLKNILDYPERDILFHSSLNRIRNII